MTFRPDRLSMVGLGINKHTQPHEQFPAVTPGNHLRWSFDPAIGFARHGYYLYRREHVGDQTDPIELGDYIKATRALSRVHTTTTPFGDITIESPQPQRFVSSGSLTADLNADPLTVAFDQLVFAVTLMLDVSDETTVRARADGVVVDEATVTSDGPLSLSFDRIESVSLVGGPATLTAIAFHPIARGLDEGWAAIAGFDAPLTLPLTHPDYPARNGAQNLDANRTLATDRISYGDEAYYTDPRATHDAGSIDVTHESLVVTGHKTNWTQDLAGQILRVVGDETAYLVTEIRPGNGATDELLLSRPYEGPDATDARYEFAEDRFGQLHDSLVHLVDDGRDAGGMVGRTLPMPVDSGRVGVVWNGQQWAFGWNAGWDDRVEGLYLQVAVDDAGTVSVQDGSHTVERDQGSVANPHWDPDLEGLSIRFEDQRAVYRIESVTAGSAALELDRPYVGPSLSNATVAVFEPDRYRIESVHQNGTRLKLDRPYRGPTRITSYLLTGAFGPQGEAATTPWQVPLETVLTGCIDPAIAQAVGLYWIDTDAEPDISYDYLLVADHVGRVGEEYYPGMSMDPSTLELWWDDAVDGYVTFDVRRGGAEPLEPPTDATVHELPPSPPRSHVRSDGTRYGSNTAGLGWAAGTDGALGPGAAVQYHLWRHAYDGGGRPEENSAPPVDAYDPLTAPGVAGTDRRMPLVVGPAGAIDADGWPDTPIRATDPGLLDGWYSYRLNGVDLFGRASDLSEPARWLDDGMLEHAVAIELADDRAPPPPRGVEAEALDPEFTGTGDTTLAVSWRWPAAYERQAPDATDFQIHYRPGSLNDQPGTITAVNSLSDRVHVIETDIGARDPADGYLGATLHVGDRGYEVLESWAAADDMLALRILDNRLEAPDTLPTEDGDMPVHVANGGPNAASSQTAAVAVGPSQPVAGANCTVSIPPAYRAGTATLTDGDTRVTGFDTDWTSALEGMSFTTPDGGRYAVATVHDDDCLDLDRPYVVPAAGLTGRERFAYAIEHPVRADFSRPETWDSQLTPADWQNREGTVSIDASVATVVATDPDNIHGTDHRTYETTVSIPAVGSPPKDPFAPSEAEPITTAHVGVSTRDERGNEGAVSAPIACTRVLGTAPDPPAAPSFESSIDVATAPDYDGQSHYTVRFVHPGPHRTVHVFRAMDKALFRTDWTWRRANANVDPSTLPGTDPTDLTAFPPYRRDDASQARRQGIADEIKSLHATVAASNEFDAALDHYEALEPDTFQTLAALDANQPAYTQRTIDPLTPDDYPNRKGPDYEAGDPGPDFQPGPNAPAGAVDGAEMCAWIDSFDGKSRRTYVYRTGSVNAAGTRSAVLSDPSRPVQARDAVPPTPPSPNSIVAGHHDDTESDDRALTLSWDPSPETDTMEYVVYRTSDPDATQDIRRMDEVARVPHTASDSDTVPPSVVWSDTDRRPDRTHSYRITAVDETGNESNASAVLTGRPFDFSVPSPPPIETLAWVQVDADGTVHPYDETPPADEYWRPAIHVTWDAPDTRTRVELVRDGTVEPVSPWLDADVDEFVHVVVRPRDYTVRLAVENPVGTRNETFDPATLATPGGGA